MKGGISSAPSKGNKNARLVRDNTLVRSSYRTTAPEARFVNWLFWQYQQTKSREQVIYINELAEFCGVKGRSVYQTMYDMCYKLQSRVVVIWDADEGVPSFVNFTKSITPNLGEGTITAVVHSDLVPLLDDKVIGNQTITSLQMGSKLKSFYAMRGYDLAMCHGFRTNGFIYHLEELKAELGVLELQKKNKKEVKIKNDRFPEWKKFKQKVLDRIEKEVSEATDIKIKFVPIRSGRNVTTVQLIAHKKGNSISYEGLTGGEVSLVKMLEKVGMPNSEARRWVKNFSESDPSRITWHARQCLSKKKPLAWLRSGLKKDYRKSMVSDRDEQLADIKKRNRKTCKGDGVHAGKQKTLKELLKERE